MTEETLLDTTESPSLDTTAPSSLHTTEASSPPEPQPATIEPQPVTIDIAPPTEPATAAAAPTVRDQISSLTTRYLAATLIAAPNFPRRSQMPKPLPPPFASFGHQVLFDYQKLVAIVWQVAMEIRARTQESRTRSRIWCMSIALTLLSAGVTTALVVDGPATIGIVLLAVMMATLLALAVTENNKQDLKRQIAAIRADALEKLIRDELAVNDDMPETHGTFVGNGALGTDQVPIVTVMHESDPFSGYGRLQAENLFVCRPKEDEPDRRSIAELNECVKERIIAKVSELGLPETTFGDVVVLHGVTLTMDSPWLEVDKVPRLWLERARVPEVHEIDPSASARVHFATQIILPQHMTAATFFVRLFTRLLKHEMETNAESKSGPERATSKPAAREAMDYLQAVGRVNKSGPRFQRHVDIRSIMEVNADEELHRGPDYAFKFSQVVSQSVMWPGSYLRRSINFREANSLTLPADFFGQPESIAAVRTVYDQLARVILDTLDENGFDISDYRNSEGQYAIRADKIEQLVVGERIHMGTDKKASQGTDSPQASVSSAQKAAA